MSSQYQHTIADDPAHRGGPLSGARVMGWLFLVASMVWPRLVIVSFWIFDHNGLGNAFGTWVIPALGFLVAPWTIMTYAFAWSVSSDAVTGLEWVLVACGVVLDVVTWLGARRLLAH